MLVAALNVRKQFTHHVVYSGNQKFDAGSLTVNVANKDDFFVKTLNNFRYFLPVYCNHICYNLMLVKTKNKTVLINP